MHRLTPRLDGLMCNVIRKISSRPNRPGRSAGRLEQVLSEFVEGIWKSRLPIQFKRVRKGV